MPELPEVEIGKRLAEKHLKGKKIETVIVNGNGDEIVFCGLEPSKIIENLKDKAIIDCFRKGKYIWMELDKQPHISFHFGMTGAFWVKGHMSPKYVNLKYDPELWPPKFSKFQLILDDGTEFAFTNIRRLGRVQFSIDPLNNPPISELGYDALTDNIEDSLFVKIYQKMERPIKAALLDQSLISGMGNWIADEVLYQCNVHPSTQCKALKESDLINMKSKMIYIINTACDANGDMSKFPENWLVHYRWGKGNQKPTQDFYGRAINFILIGGRSSAFVTQTSSKQSKKKETQKRANEKIELHSTVDTLKTEGDNDTKEMKPPVKRARPAAHTVQRLTRMPRQASIKSSKKEMDNVTLIKQDRDISKLAHIKSSPHNKNRPTVSSPRNTKPKRKPNTKIKYHNTPTLPKKPSSFKKDPKKQTTQTANTPRRMSQRVASRNMRS